MTHYTDEIPQQAHKIDRLLDAIELIKADKRQDAQAILRSIIREDSNFEDAWLWMSLLSLKLRVTVQPMDLAHQSAHLFHRYLKHSASSLQQPMPVMKYSGQPLDYLQWFQVVVVVVFVIRP